MTAERELTPEILNLILAKVVKPAVFIYADFPSGIQRKWTGTGPITFMGQTWDAVGGIITMETIAETTDTAAKGLVVKMNGLRLSFVQEITNDMYQGRQAILYFAFFNANEDTLYAMPGPFWEGFLDSDEISYDANTSDLSIKCEHGLIDILRKREWQYNDADQRALFPGRVDTGLTRLPKIQDMTIPWGRTQQ